MKAEKTFMLSFVKEVINHFESMPMLTDDEEALLESAHWTKDKLTHNEEEG